MSQTASQTESAPEGSPLASLRSVVSVLRVALAGLFDELGLDVGRPQSVGRALELDKTLAWRACRFCREDEVLDALGFLPGESALANLIAAAQRQGASAERLSRAREAAASFQGQVELHAGSRLGLRRLVASLDAERDTPRLQDEGRRQAFQGNAAIWGVQARSRIGLQLMAPNLDDPSRLDVISAAGLHELTRMRASARWPIVRHTAYDPDGPRNDQPEPLDSTVGQGEPPLLREFCSEHLPPLRKIPKDDSTLFELGEGGLGRSGAVTCLFGIVRRADHPRTGKGPDDLAEHLSYFNTPVERGLFDVLLHRDLDVGTPELELCSLMESVDPIGPDRSSRYTLPVAEQVHELTGPHPVLETPCMPRHRELVEFAVARSGHALGDFRIFRVEFSHPPIPTVAILRHRFEAG